MAETACPGSAATDCLRPPCLHQMKHVEQNRDPDGEREAYDALEIVGALVDGGERVRPGLLQTEARRARCPDQPSSGRRKLRSSSAGATARGRHGRADSGGITFTSLRTFKKAAPSRESVDFNTKPFPEDCQNDSTRGTETRAA